MYADEEQNLQQLLDDLFDTSHPDFTKEIALKNLHNNFTVPVDLCKSCLFVQHQEDLDKHQSLCEECAQIEGSEESDKEEEKDNQDNTVVELQQRINQQDQTILTLEERINQLEKLNKQLLQIMIEDSQYTEQRSQKLISLSNELNF